MHVRRWVQARCPRSLLVALLVGLVAGTVLALAGGARRTASAPDRYTAANGGDPDLVVVQPIGEPLTDEVRRLRGVSTVQAITFVTAFPVIDGVLTDVNPFAGDDRQLGGRIEEGRFTDPAQPDEFTVNRAALALFGGRVGHRFHFNSFSQLQTDRNEFVPEAELEGPSFAATLVGVVTYPSDLDDPKPSIVFSEALLPAQPDMGIVATFMAIRTDDGVAPLSILEATRRLPGGEALFEDAASVVSPGARRAINLQVSALWIVTVIAAVVAALVVGILLTRHLRVSSAIAAPHPHGQVRSETIDVGRAAPGPGLDGEVEGEDLRPVLAGLAPATGLTPNGALDGAYFRAPPQRLAGHRPLARYLRLCTIALGPRSAPTASGRRPADGGSSALGSQRSVSCH